MKGCESTLNETVFISFKCTTAENIYLFIISRCHLRTFFYYRIISLTSSSVFISSGVDGRLCADDNKKHIVHQQMIRVIALMIPMIVYRSLESASWEIKPSKSVNNCKSHFLLGFSHYTELYECAAIE